MNPLFVHGEEIHGVADYGAEWIVLLVPFAGLAVVIGALYVFGRRSVNKGFFAPVGHSLERVTGLPAWSAGGVGMGLFALAVAVIGFYWDVAWHIEKGRDAFIFTPAHMGILLGLIFIVVAGVTSVIFATLRRADVGFRFGPLTVPFGALSLGLLGFGALAGFPLDEFWHRAYGVDVTMWGPTHLVMISGASLTPIALSLLVIEGQKTTPGTRVPGWIAITLSGAVLAGLSTWTGEFDFGVPQFQQLYHPVLLALAASIGLTVTRAVLGPGGAIKAALAFILLRSSVALLLGGGLGVLLPRFPLYLVAAVLVELAARGASGRSPLRTVTLTGILVGTFGLGAEWAWTHVWGWHPWGPTLFPGIIAAVLVAIPGALLGTAMGEVLSGRRRSFGRLPLALAGAGIVLALAFPFPRNSAPIQAVVTTEPAGPGTVDVAIALDPKDAAEPADWFEVTSWQGGALQNTPMEKIAPGRYSSSRPVPVSGEWKSFIRIAKKDVMVAVPVFFPADPEIGASEVPVAARREIAFRRDTEFLLREAKDGSSTPALLAYGAILALATLWVAGLSYCFAKVERGRPMRADPQTRPVGARSEEMAVS